METAGTRIKALAAAAGLPAGPYELAAALGVSYESLRKWTAGDTAPNRSRAEQIAAKLGCKPEAFMHGVQARPPAASLDLTDAERAGVLAFRQGYPELLPIFIHAAQELAALNDADVRDNLIAKISRALTLEQAQRAGAQPAAEPTPSQAQTPRTHRARSQS